MSSNISSLSSDAWSLIGKERDTAKIFDFAMWAASLGCQFCNEGTTTATFVRGSIEGIRCA